MKHWGLGSGPLEARVAHEVHYLLSSISDEGTNPIDPAPILNCAISNVICSSLMSTRFHHKDEKFKRFMHLFDEGFRLFQSLESLPSIPFQRHLPPVLNPQSSVLKKLKTNREEMLEFVSLIIQDHKESLDTASPRDLLDSYLIEMLEDRAEVCGPDPERQLEQVILDILMMMMMMMMMMMIMMMMMMMMMMSRSSWTSSPQGWRRSRQVCSGPSSS